MGLHCYSLLTISVSTVSFPKSRSEGEHKVYASSTNKTPTPAPPTSFLNNVRSFACRASNMFRDDITTLHLHDFLNYWQFKDHSSRKSHANWTNNTFFFVYFFSSNCLLNYFLYMKIAKIHFHVAPLKSILVSKICQFWTKTKDALRILKIHIMFCSPNGAEKIYQLMA